jgi:uncharacterized protein DUF5658
VNSLAAHPQCGLVMSFFQRALFTTFAVSLVASPAAALSFDLDLQPSLFRHLDSCTPAATMLFASAAPAASQSDSPMPLRTLSVLPQRMPPVERPSTPHRKIVNALATTQLAMSAFDSYSTVAALNHGLKERNPVLAAMAANPGTMVVTKTAIAFVAVEIARRVSKHHSVAAIAALVAANVGTAMVAAHNMSLIRSTTP